MSATYVNINLCSKLKHGKSYFIVDTRGRRYKAICHISGNEISFTDNCRHPFSVKQILIVRENLEKKHV